MHSSECHAAPIARRVVVSGRVTGVAFRWYTQQKADQYAGLKGYVRNVDGHTVECVVQGEPWMVEEMVEWLRHGPGTARVESVQVSSRPLDGSLGGFRIAP